MTDVSNTSKRSRSPLTRRRFLAAASSVSAVSLAGCTGDGGGGGSGTAGSSGSSKVELRFWNGSMTDEPGNKEYWTDAISRFNKQSNNVQVDLRGVPYEGMFKKIRAGAQAGPDQMPHMAEIASRIDVLLAAESLPLTDLWEQSKLSDALVDSVAKLGKAFGQQSIGEQKMVAWPVGLRPFLSIYRNDWLNQAGIDPSEVNAKAGALDWRTDLGPIYKQLANTSLGQKGGYAPSSTGMKEGDEEILSHYMGQWGVSNMSVVNTAGTHAVIDTKKARDVIRFQKEYVDKGYFHQNSINAGDEEITTLQWAGKICDCHVQDVADGWSSYRDELGRDSYIKNYTWGLPPQREQKSTYAMIPIFAPYKKAFQSQAEKDAMVEFVDWIAAEEQQALNRTKALGWLPPDPKVFDNSYFTKTRLHEQFWGVIQRIVEEYEISTLPAVPGASQINFTIPRKMHQRILIQGMSVDKATRMAADEINQVLKDNNHYEPR